MSGAGRLAYPGALMHPAGDDILERLAAELRAEGTVISPHVLGPAEPPRLGLITRELVGADSELPQVVECVREGYLLHYRSPRLIDPPDPHLALLSGDYLYARALERLAAAGRLEAIRELADLISLSAQIHESSAQADLDADRLWLASTLAIALGAGPAHQRAKASLRCSGDVGPLFAAALRTAERTGVRHLVAETG